MCFSFVILDPAVHSVCRYALAKILISQEELLTVVIGLMVLPMRGAIMPAPFTRGSLPAQLGEIPGPD